MILQTLRKKYPNMEFFLVLIFPHLTEYGEISLFRPNTGKYRPEKTTLYLDIFRTVREQVQNMPSCKSC